MNVKRFNFLLLFFVIIVFSTVVFARDSSNSSGNEGGKKTEETFWSTMPLVMKKPEEKKWNLNIGGWYERKWGNTETKKMNGTLNYTYDNGITSYNFSGSGFYEKTLGEETVNSGSGLVKSDHYIFHRMELFVYSLNEYDRIADLKFRNNSGGGAKLVFLRNKFIKTDISGAPVYQYEKYENASADHDFRASFRYRLRMKPFEYLKLEWVIFYVPKMQDFSEYRVNSDSSLKFNFAGLPFSKDSEIGFKTGYIMKYNSSPAEDTKEMDRIVYARLELGF